MRNRTRFRLGGRKLVATEQTAPTVLSATIPAAGTTITIVFSEPVFVPAATGLTIDDGVIQFIALTVASGNGTATVVFNLSETAVDVAIYTRTYVPGAISDLLGNRLAAFSGAAVTNNSTQ